MMKLAFLLALTAQFPDQPSKTLPTPAVPSKSPVQASPQQALASPQQSYQAAPAQDTVVLRAPVLYQIQRQVVLAAPVSYQTVQAAPVVAYAQTGCVAQQALLNQGFVQHSAIVNHGLQSAQVNHGLIGNGVGRQPRKIVTKQVTKTKGRGRR